MWFKKDRADTPALINFDNKFNDITSAYVARLDFKIRKINVKA